MNKKNLVLVETDFGYHNYFWYPSFPLAELKNFWTNIDKISNKSMIVHFKGTLTCLDDLPHDEYDTAIDMWTNLSKSGKIPYIHFCCDDDSYLFMDQIKVRHKGYIKSKDDYED